MGIRIVTEPAWLRAVTDDGGAVKLAVIVPASVVKLAEPEASPSAWMFPAPALAVTAPVTSSIRIAPARVVALTATALGTATS